LLGVKPEAGLSELKTAFRKKAMKFHPDLNPGDPEAEERFKKLVNAKEAIEDAIRKGGTLTDEANYSFRRSASNCAEASAGFRRAQPSCAPMGSFDDLAEMAAANKRYRERQNTDSAFEKLRRCILDIMS